MKLTEIAFSHLAKRNYITIKHLRYLQGLDCNIYYPLDSSSPLYNDSSQEYEYNTTPDEDGRYLVTGIFGLQEMTGLELENYSSFNYGDGAIYTIGENFSTINGAIISIPRNSKIEIFFLDGMKVFRTQNADIINGVNGIPMYGVHELVPII